MYKMDISMCHTKQIKKSEIQNATVKKRWIIRVMVLQVQEVVLIPNPGHRCSTTNLLEQETTVFPPAVKLVEHAERESQVQLFVYTSQQFQGSWMKISISRTQVQYTPETPEHFCEAGWAVSCGELCNNWDFFWFG